MNSEKVSLWVITGKWWDKDEFHKFSTMASTPAIAIDKFKAYYPKGTVQSVQVTDQTQDVHLR